MGISTIQAPIKGASQLNELNRLIYVLQTPLRRWKNETDIVYFIDMPLSQRSSKTEIVITCKKSWDSELEAFATWREKTDPLWQWNDYTDLVKKRIHAGAWCYIARQKNTHSFIGILFAVGNSCYVEAVRYQVKIPPDTVGIFDVYTSIEFRGQGFYTQLFNTAINDFLKKGYRLTWIWIMPHNLTSLAVHNQLGLSHIFLKVIHRQRWGFRWHQIEKVDQSIAELIVRLNHAD